MADCSVDECTTRATKRGMCGCHYQRYMKHGDVHKVLAGLDVATVPRDSAECPECGASMAGKKRNAVYCSRSCKGKATERRRRRENAPRVPNPKAKPKVDYPPECDGMTPTELRKWRYDNTPDGDRRRARSRRYYEANKAQQALYTRNYTHMNRAKRAAQQARRKALIEASEPINITAKEWRRLKARYHNACAYCRTPSSALHMDHVVPLTKGGRHAPANILPACPTCNISKRDHLLAVWRHKIIEGG